jgi:hypothetical protein
MQRRTTGLLLGALFCARIAFGEQGAPPRLDRAQRERLAAVVTAVDAAHSMPHTAASEWQTHILRASDGAHYVAFSITPPADRAPRGTTTLYVRLAARSERGAPAGRSAVLEWLKGMRSDPLLAQKRRGIAFGEMPIFGPGAIASRGPGQQANDLALLSLERERARERREAAERARRAELEGTGSTRARDAIHPFEDFAVDVTFPPPAPDGTLRIQRSLTASPGDYDLYVAWASTPRQNEPPDIHYVKQRLDLPPASTTQLALSSVIVADSVTTRDTPYPPDQQAAHPYAVGTLEIAPAADDTFTNDERLTLAFQVINAGANASGKPDITIGFRLARLTSSGEQTVGTLNPQYYNEATLPPDFDLTKGHPLFVATAVPLKTLARGDYRLTIEATDKHVPRSTRTALSFRIVATLHTLLASAPGAAPFAAGDLVHAGVLRDLSERLQPAQPTPALRAAIDAARDGKLMELLREDTASDVERPVRTTLRGIGLLAFGDARMACTLLQQALAAERHPVTLFYAGGCFAISGNDREAVAAWRESLSAGVPPAIVAPLLADAHLRLGEPARVREIAERYANDIRGDSITPRLARMHLAEGRHEDALALLQPYLDTNPGDLDAQYVRLHALFTGFVRGSGTGATPAGREQLRRRGLAYLEAKGRNAATVREWLDVLP